MQAEKAACFKRGHCARAGQNGALRLQPGVGGEKHNRLFLFSSLRACRTEKGVLVPAGSGGKKHQSPPSFSSLRARRTETCAFVQALFLGGGSSREWGKETQPLVFISHCTRTTKPYGFRKRRLCFSAVFQHNTTERSQDIKLPAETKPHFLSCTRAVTKNENKRLSFLPPTPGWNQNTFFCPARAQ